MNKTADKLLVVASYFFSAMLFIVATTGFYQAYSTYVKYGFSYETATIIDGITTIRSVTLTENMLVSSLLLAPAITLMCCAYVLDTHRKRSVSA